MAHVFSASQSGEPGAMGQSLQDDGLSGLTFADFHSGVHGVADMEHGKGVSGQSLQGTGVYGNSTSGRGVEGWSQTNYGVTGDSQSFPGVRGSSQTGRGVEGWSTNSTGVYAISIHGIGMHAKGPRLAGLFEGDIEVTGDIRLTNADCAEDFDIAEGIPVEPGSVMVMGEEGKLNICGKPYDTRVVGVVSGAGDYKPGIVLDKQVAGGNRQPIGLLGKVFCKVHANYGSIRAGDLLTTSLTPGHAMRISDPLRAFGSVIGKALKNFTEGQGMIPVLITLQ